MDFPEFEFEKMIWIDKKIHYAFSLKKRNSDLGYTYTTLQDQSYLVDYEGNKIYKHRSFTV